MLLNSPFIDFKQHDQWQSLFDVNLQFLITVIEYWETGQSVLEGAIRIYLIKLEFYVAVLGCLRLFVDDLLLCFILILLEFRNGFLVILALLGEGFL